MRLLFFAGSLRKDSCNKKLVREAMRLVEAKGGHQVEYVDLKDYPMPPYDGDIEASSGIPESTKQLGAKIKEADAIILSTPEYNGSIPGIFKNVVDWLSRERPVSITGKQLLLLAASPGALGGTRSLWHTRQPLEMLEVFVYPSMIGLPDAYNAFDEQGRLKDAKTTQRLQKLLDKFLEYANTKEVGAKAA
jgi:chromate reductase, NAD(P)H dehydrogenase (quinone)